MAEDEGVDVKEEEGGNEPGESDAILDFDLQVKEDEKPEDKEAEREAEAEAKKEDEKAKVDVDEIVAKTRQALRAEEKAPDGPKIFTEQELEAAEAQLDKQLEDGDITQAEYRMYLRRVDKIRRDQEREESDRSYQERRDGETAAEAMTLWAEQNNFKPALDKTSPESVEATSWAKKTLAASYKNGYLVMPEKIGQVVLAVLHAGSKGDPVKKEKEAEERGRQQGAKEANARRTDLLNRKPPPKSEKDGGKNKEAPISAKEQEVFDRIGAKVNPKTYRRIQEGLAKGARSITVG